MYLQAAIETSQELSLGYGMGEGETWFCTEFQEDPGRAFVYRV